jgi:branched-chain amino acid transport system substrate-binding protein
MKRLVSVLAVLAVVASMVAGCGGTSTTSGSIRLGVVTSVTGSQATFGEAQKRGYELALEEINAKGGVLGRKIELVYEDDASKAETAVSAMEKLATQDKVPLVLGSYSSAATLPMGAVADKYQVPLIVPTAATDKLTESGYKYVFRICAPSSVYAGVMIGFLATEIKPKTLAIIFENTSFGTSTAEPAKAAAEAKGIKVVAYEYYTAGAPDFKPLLTKVKAANPEAVFFVSYLLDATLLLRQSKELDFNPTIYTGGGAGFSLEEFIAESGAGKNAEYTLSVTQWTDDAKWAGAKEFAAKFKQKYNVAAQYHSAETYATLYLAVDALKRAGAADSAKLRTALVATDIKDGNAFGPVKFNEKGQNTHPMLITQVQKGKFVTVYPKEYAAAPFIHPTPPWSKR